MKTYSPSNIPSSSNHHHPLLSTIITLYTLILLYFPHIFLKAIASPVFLSTTVLLLSLLKLGATQKKSLLDHVSKQPKSTRIPAPCDPNPPTSDSESKVPKPYYFDPLLEWDVSAPLEVILEEYDEGQELDEENDCREQSRRTKMADRYPCLSRYYPESDSDSNSDTDSEDEGFPVIINRWDSRSEVRAAWKEEGWEGDRDREDDDDDRLIEIQINDGKMEEMKMIEIQGFEEDNLIEIEIFSGEGMGRDEITER